MELALSICLGIGLSAACGFRIFVPLLGMSAAALAGQLPLSPGFEWVGTWPALACFTTATVLEVAAYYVPWIDNLLDSMATPAAVVAGTMITASVVTDMPPLWQWTLAGIGGGGTAGLVQTATVALRGTSSATTGGLANFLVATAELVASICTTLLALLLPIFCVGLLLLSGGLVLARLGRRRERLAVAGTRQGPGPA
ncbi:MAG: DUF4126 domain-containing protein [Pirellulaceae bacterium]